MIYLVYIMQMDAWVAGVVGVWKKIQASLAAGVAAVVPRVRTVGMAQNSKLARTCHRYVL